MSATALRQPYCKLAFLTLTCEGTSLPTFWSLLTRVCQLTFAVWRPLKMVQYTFETCAETPSRRAISSCSDIPDLYKNILYHLLAIIGQCYNKDVNDVFILSNRNKRSDRESKNHWRILTGITSADFQTLFSKCSAWSQPAICVRQPISFNPAAFITEPAKLCDKL